MFAATPARTGARLLGARASPAVRRAALLRHSAGPALASQRFYSSQGPPHKDSDPSERRKEPEGDGGIRLTAAVFAAALTGALIVYVTSPQRPIRIHAEAASDIASAYPPGQNGRLSGVTGAAAGAADEGLQVLTQQEQMRARAQLQGVYAWGSNRHAVVAPDQPSVSLIRSPRSIPFFDGMALRDLVLAERHGVAVDAKGDVLQWGAGFFDARSRTAEGDRLAIEDIPYTSRASRYSAKPVAGREEAAPMLPVRTLVGKDIVKVQANDTKVFALSRNGDVWIVSAIQEQQKPRSSSALSWLPSFLGGGGASIDAQKFTLPKGSSFRRGERIIDIVAGEAHLLALTNQERTFGAPTGPDANTYGQLGFRRAVLNTVQASAEDVNAPSAMGTVTGSIEVSLEPRLVLDAIVNAPAPTAVDLLPAWALPPSVEERAAEAQRKREEEARRRAAEREARKAAAARNATVPSIVEDAKSIRYCTTLHEVPALRGVPVVQVAAGTHHSLARTSDGRVLGWGRHTHGQSGVGPQVAIECVTAPTEVVLARCFPSSVDVRCNAIYAGSDNSFFVTSRLEPLPGRQGLKSVIDVLASGKGIWGTLGHASWQQVAASPVRVKTVSGLQEYSERTGKIHPVDMYSITVGSPGHVALVLDTVDDTHTAFGRDVNVWGSNGAYQLGTGKRNNLAVPQHLPPLPPLTPSEGAEAPALPDDKERERLREEDINSGALTHMPHKRLQLASRTVADTHAAPRFDESKGHLQRGGVKRHVPVEETMVAGAAAMAIFWKTQ